MFNAKRFDAKTDANGNFDLTGLPSDVRLSILAGESGFLREAVLVDQVYLESGEERPRAVKRLAEPGAKRSNVSLADRMTTILRDCELMGYHAMVIASSDDAATSGFVSRNFVDYDSNPLVAAYMQIVLTPRQRNGQANGGADDADFMKQRGWRIPDKAGCVLAWAIDAQGHPLGHLELDVQDKEAAAAASAFVKRYAPAPVDAEQQWQAAFDEAKRTNRRVWACICQRYCGPCFKLARWMDEHRELLEKDYVILKIDNIGNTNGRRVADRLLLGQNHGVPFHAVFDQNETLLVNSAGRLGNIGFPTGFEGRKQLTKMLAASRQNLTDAEVQSLLDTIE